MFKFATLTSDEGQLLRQIIRNLKGAREYSFASAYFDLKIIDEYFESLEFAIEKGVRVRFLVSNNIDLKTFNIIKAASDNNINDFMSFTNFNNMSKERKAKLFNWINESAIEFKMAFNSKGGIFHFKLGYILKEDGSLISWSGSANHTYNALTGKNNEHLSFFKSEDQGEDDNYQLFNRSWNGELENSYILSIDKVLASELSIIFEESTTVKFLKEKWDTSIYYDGKTLYFISQENLGTYFMPSQTSWKHADDFSWAVNGEFNKLAVKHWIENNDVYVPYSTLKFLEDNISKMEALVSLGFNIKEDWETIKETEDYREFVKLTDTLIRKPFDLQYKQAYFAYKLKKSLNFSVPGTGKTMVSLTTFNALVGMNIANRLIVIGPTSSHETWIEEFEMTFGYKPKTLNLSSVSATSDEKVKILYSKSLNNYDMIIMHFATASNYVNELKEIIQDSDMFIIDEAHYIKNMHGTWGKAITKLGRIAKHSLLLTGTPAANGTQDINNLIEITYGDAFLNFFNISQEKERLVTSLMMRITYHDLKMQFKQINHQINYSLSYDQRECIDSLNHRLKNEWGASFLEIYMKKMQAMSSLNSLQSVGFNSETSNKLKEMIKLIDKSKNIVIWANFKNSITSIENTLKKLYPDTNIYTYFGEDSAVDRVDSINQYKKDGGILIATPQTLAESVSLHKHTDYTIYFEYTFNLIHWIQSRNRTFRYGMDKDMNYYILTTQDDPLEQFVYDRLQEKQNNQEALISYSGDDTKDNTISDIRDFLEGMVY